MCIKAGQELGRAHPAAPWNAPTGAAVQGEMPRDRKAWEKRPAIPTGREEQADYRKKGKKGRECRRREKNRGSNEAPPFPSLPSSIPPPPAPKECPS